MFRSRAALSKSCHFRRKKVIGAGSKNDPIKKFFFPLIITFYRSTKTAGWYFKLENDLKAPHPTVRLSLQWFQGRPFFQIVINDKF